MARTFGAVKSDMLVAMGRTDANTVTLCERAINMACEIIGIAYRVPEFQTTANGTITANTNTWDISTSPANFAEVVALRNTTSNFNCHYIPFELWEHVVPAGELLTRFYTQWGRTLYFKKTPAANTSVTMYYTRHHVDISSNSAAIPFDGYDGAVLSLAMTIAWATFEEVESSELWQKISGLLGLSAERMYQVRAIVQGAPVNPEVAISGSEPARTNA